MHKIELKIGNRPYEIACSEGEEDHIKSLAKKLDIRVNAISQTLGTASDATILAITALMMEDEINSLHNGKDIPLPLEHNEHYIEQRVNQEVALALVPVTQKLEELANRLENS